MLISNILQLILLSVLYRNSNGARILGIFPMAAKSHYFLGNALMKGLAEAGHNVTMISPFEEEDPPKGGSYRDVVLTGFREDFVGILNVMDPFSNQNKSAIKRILQIYNIFVKINDDLFTNDNVQKLLKSDERFDVVIIEQFFTDALKIFGHVYNVPVIAFSTVGANPSVNGMVGNPSPLSYIPRLQSASAQGMSFKERLFNTLLHLFLQLSESLYYFPQHNQILQKHFSDPPNIYDLYHNVSLVLLNSHESLNQPVPYVPNMVQIGGFHVRPSKKLPQDLQKYLDNATEGVVYFSMGSNLRSKNFPADKRDAFLAALGKLKEKVLWKWEDDELPGKPSNVKLAKWFPQQDILAHPNVKLFITHGGLLSTTETVYHGVPILAIPVFGDQPMNAILATNNGYALSLPYADPTFSEEKLSELLHELLTNPKYRENVKKRSQIFHERPMTPMTTAVYWVEYVIRNKGAPHLKVAGVDLPWYIYHSLDVISFIAIVTSLTIHLFYVVIRKVLSWYRTCRTKSKME